MPTLREVRVIDFSRLLPGPYCTMLLADMGADVIKVESTLLGDPVRITPPFAHGESLSFASVNRNKRSLAVNYRKPDGKELLKRLLATGDVVVETFKPGQAARLGLDYESVRAINPNVVYCSLSGYGQEGTYARRSGHDINFLALSGALDLLRGPGGRPTLPAFQLADVAGGALFATIAILAALLERSQIGQGQYLDVSIWEGMASLLSLQLTPMNGVGQGNLYHSYLAGALPGYNVYETADGQYMALGAFEPVLWAEFCKAVGREDLKGYHLPVEEDREWVISEVAAIFRQRTRREWEAFFADKDLCCEPVLSLQEAGDEAVGRIGGRWLELARPGQVVLRSLDSPRELTGTDHVPTPAPRLGEHTEEILAELGFSDDAIEGMRTRRVVATPEDVTVKLYRGVPGQ